MKYYVMFRASSGRWAFLVSPTVFGESDKYLPWMRAEHRATLFDSKVAATAARDSLLAAIRYQAPELNGNLERRLRNAGFVRVEVSDAEMMAGKVVNILGQDVLMS